LVKALINDAFKPALQIVEREWRKEREEGKAKKYKNAGAAALVIVGRLDQDKFFSNGAPDPNSFRESDLNPFCLGFDYPVSSRDPSFLAFSSGEPSAIRSPNDSTARRITKASTARRRPAFDRK